MAGEPPADDTESMPPPWPGKASQDPGLDMDSSSGVNSANVDESAGGAGGSSSSDHYNRPGTRTNHLRAGASQGSRASSSSDRPEAAATTRENEAPESLPTESELVGFLAAMIISESGAVVAPPSGATASAIFKPTNLLNERCWAAVVALFKARRKEIVHITPTTQVDKQEALGLLMAALTGEGLLTVGVGGQARVAGTNAQNRLTAMEKAAKKAKAAMDAELRKEKDDARKAGREPALDAIKSRAAKATAELEGTAVKLNIPPLPRPLAPPTSGKRKRKQLPEHPPLDEARAAKDAAMQAMEGARAAVDLARIEYECEEGRHQRAVQRLEAATDAIEAMDGLPNTTAILTERDDLIEAQLRAEAKAEEAGAAMEAALEAVKAAAEVAKQKLTEARRMLQWLTHRGVVTPFPWAGELYVEPCNEEDIAYWIRASQQWYAKWPPGLAEWHERSGRRGAPVVEGVAP